MIKTLYVLDRNKNIIGFISNNGTASTPFFNDKFKQILSTGAETFEFDVIADDKTNRLLIEGNYIMFEYNGSYKMFQIMTIEDDDSSYRIIKSCYCEIVGLELLNSYVRPCTIQGDIVTFFNTILQDSNWKLGRYSPSLVNISKDIDITESKSIYALIQENISAYNNIEIEFRTEFSNNKVTGYYIDVYEDGGRGKVTHKRFEHGTNVTGITRKGDITGFYSALIGEGKNGINFKDIIWSKENGDHCDKPAGQDFLLDDEAHKMFNLDGKYITGLYKTEDTNAYDLIQSTYNKLQEVKKVKYSYEVEVGTKLEEFEQIGIGDTVYVIDNNFNPPILLEARVSELEISFSDYRSNKCTLANFKEVKSNIKSLSKEDIMAEVLEYIKSLEIGMLDKTTIDRLSQYLYAMGIEKDEIDRIVEELNKIANEQLEEEQRNKVQGEYIDILINDSTRKYICDVVKSLKFRLPPAIPAGFSTTLEFATEKDTAPTKFFQEINCWCYGVDCWNGGLVPFADTTYTIVLTPNTDTNIVQKYRGNVTKVSHGGSYSSYENKTSYVEKVREVMQSYYYVRDKFIYNTITPFSFKDPATATNKPKWQTNGKFHIDCSTFVHFVIRGITYEQSTYAIPTKSPYFLSNKYDYSFVLDASISDRDRYASDMARACIEQGWQLNIDMTNRANWKQLRAGDIVFWAKRYGEESFEFKERYMKVGHVAIVSTVLEDGDVTTYESTSGLNNSILNRRLSANYPDKILFVARPRR